ncbi:hypothetical protein DFW101_2220 [Solidesulfovibrio carbinoliphilus subsp. oakridgensis]|uniref:Uncharacterized protein n=1 Tax=Solidesulfovibrio carbinoliphilus subsp. oakridgensis TaxID=694327 RepID=G7QA74_9BACT|nr:hypothetical protein [Solidesulfovibrio carbinoliphilus]EHJ48225.1 hypothetical protein DFW101_2220 [Solidesulfovibrio carbinoliphilus subsp. oakridgensis]
MEQDKNVAYYLEMIVNAPSYQDLVFFRNRTFDAIEATLAAEDVEAVKRAWTERAKDENVPVVPPGQKKTTGA